MLATVIGLGSMGRRRASILKSLGLEVEGIDPNVELPEIPSVERPSGDVVFICTPPDVRERPLRMALEHGAPMLIEKPLAAPGAITGETIDALWDYPCRVSENLFYSPDVDWFFRSVKDMEKRDIYAWFDFELSKWRPQTNYRKSYNARKTYSLGFDCHEINVLCGYLGRPQGVEASFSQKREKMKAFQTLRATLEWEKTTCLVALRYYEGYSRGWSVEHNDRRASILLSPSSIEPTYEKETFGFIDDAKRAGLPGLEPWVLDAMDVHKAMIQSHEERRWISLSL